ncbi:MAG: phosphatase PAP2 family protein [Candidatus Lokiarchaeota archaeon]|nr:phosphatase PAP2 family protein [Candidatus Lokiarchaeota archaeon]
MKFSRINMLLIYVILVWIILAITFGVYDLQISIAVVDENSVWGNFGADYGEMPGYGLIAVALATYLGGYFKDTKKQKILGYVGIVVGVIYVMLGVFDQELNSKNITLGSTLILSLAIYMAITWNKDWKDYRKISGLISILALLNPLLLVQIMKLLWGRVRFRSLLPEYIDFTPWFLPQGFTDNYSFPSGHTAMGMMFLPLLVSVKDRKINDPTKILITVLVIGWGLFVALSRVAVGAHYASDVLFSSGFAAIITILFYKKIYK